MNVGEWIDRNPIRVWIDEQPEARSQSLLASWIGITPMMVSLWVRGQATPNKYWAELGVCLDNPDLEQQWKKWLALREEGHVDFAESDPSVA